MPASKNKRAKQRETHAARAAYVHRNAPPTDPRWNAVAEVLDAKGFAYGSHFDEWRDMMIKRGVRPEQAIDYSAHYGTTPWWGELAHARVKGLTDWLIACGLEGDEQFYGNNSPREYMKNIVQWARAGYTSSQVRAWNLIGLTPEQVEDKSKPVIIVLEPDGTTIDRS
jgi:hypothetical protein